MAAPRPRTPVSFFTWLGAQDERQDAVGAFARLALRDRVCPKHSNRLHLFLLRYEHLPEHRSGIKAAHREWRAAR